MPKLKSIEDLQEIRERARRDILIRTEAEIKFVVGMGTCGIAAGARETMCAILDELQKREIHAHVAITGCLGMCEKEPLVSIKQSGKPTVIYGNVYPNRVPHLIEEHLVKGNVVREWVLDGMPA